MPSSSIDDRWIVKDRATGEQVRTARYGKGLRYRARYRDESGQQHYKSFPNKQKKEAQKWLGRRLADMERGVYVDPKKARMTMGEWCDVWIVGYGTRRAGTVRQAKVHIKVIKDTFGATPVAAIKPSDVKTWTATLAKKYKPSTTYATYRRFTQLMRDAVDEGIIAKTPCSRKTAPPQPKPRPYVATTEQVWALHDAMPEHLRSAVLLGAFAGLRVSEVSGLRLVDVDFMRGVISPAVQYPAEELKTEESKTPIPIPTDLALMLSANAEAHHSAGTVVTSETGRQCPPWAIERALRHVRKAHAAPKPLKPGEKPQKHPADCTGCLVPVLPTGFRFHDLRHYFASLLIASGCDVKVVQTRLRHASATTTLNTYAHLWPDNDETTRSAVGKALSRSKPANASADD